MKSFVEKTRARMGDLQSQVASGVTRVRSQLSRSNEDLGSEIGTPVASEIGSLDNLPPEEAIAKLEAQNQALWTKAQAAARIQKDNTMLQAELASARNKLVKVSDDADDQVRRVQESNDALKARLRTVMEELEQLRTAKEDTQNNPGPSAAPCVIDNDTKCSGSKAPDSDWSEQISVLKNQSKSLKDRCSGLEGKLNDSYKRVEELENENSHLLNERKLVEEEMRKCSKELTEAGEAQSYLTSVVEDLQKQLDACSPDQVVYLRGMMQRLEADNSQLQADMEVLSMQLRGTPSQSCNLESKPAAGDTFDEASYRDELEGTDYDEEGALVSGYERSEKLVDLSQDIVTEMANVGSHAKVELVLSAVQYAGLLSVVQKAMKQMESLKSRSDSQQDTFALLDQTLSRSLSITNSRVFSPCSAIEERIESVDSLIEEKQKDVADMLEIISKLKEQVKGQKCLSVPQEVQLEYLTQQLSSPEKVIKLCWEVEGLRKGIEETQREVEALREQSEQQQQELTIQWQSKQQVLAETQAHHHQFSSVSQQIEHLQQANETIQTEKTDLERELADAREELQELRVIVEELHDEVEDSMDDEYSPECIANHELKDSEPLEISISQNGELLAYRSKMEAEIMSLEADLELSRSFGRKLEEQVRKLQAERQKSPRTIDEEKMRKEVVFLQEQLVANKDAAAAEISGLQEVQVSLQSQLQRCKSHIVELTNKLRETEMVTARHETLLRVEKESHEHTREHLAHLHKAPSTNNSQSLPPVSDAESGAGNTIGELQAERDALFAELEAWKFKASELGEQADQVEAMKQESEQVSEQLSLKEAMWESERRKSDGLAAEKTKMQQELSSMQLVAGRLEDNLDKAKAEIVRLNELLESERQQYTAATRSWEEELESLTTSNLPRDLWPASVRRLVECCEEIATAGVESCEQAKRIGLEEQVEDALDRLEAVEVDSERKIAEIEAEKAAAEQKLSHLGEEMRNRESKLQEQLSAIEKSASAEKDRLETDLANLTKTFASAKNDAKVQIQKLSSALEDKSTQLIELQEKTRTMMVEKDKEIEQLKSLGHGSEGSGSQKLPVGSGHANVSGNKSMAPITVSQKAAESINDQVDGRDHLINFDPPKDVSRESSGSQELLQYIGRQGSLTEKALELKLEAARKRVDKLEMEMLDSERTHALRDKACDILKEEIAELRRAGNRDGVDVNYLKNILVSAFEKGTLPKDSPMVAVLARLLHFSPKEIQRIEAATPSHTRSSSRGLFPGWGR